MNIYSWEILVNGALVNVREHAEDTAFSTACKEFYRHLEYWKEAEPEQEVNGVFIITREV